MTSARWGGSEELWSAAAIGLTRAGYRVAASVRDWAPPHERIVELARAGVKVQSRQSNSSVLQRIRRKVTTKYKSQDEMDIISLLSTTNPSLAVFSDGNCTVPISALRHCVEKNVPFMTVGHMSSEYFGIEDFDAAEYRDLLPHARTCYFVSLANLKLFEKQIGTRLPNAKIIRNPFKVSYRADPPWKPLNDDDELRFAHVGRLHPPSKGQDILLEALALPDWHMRRWHLTFYGEGPMKGVIEELVRRYKLFDRVSFAGFVESVDAIWAQNHLLVMPSRYEGLPLAIVEAMLCNRAVVATDVAGHSEIIDDNVTGFIADYPIVPSVAEALGRAWARRSELQTIGKSAGVAIRQRVPEDPTEVFIEDLKLGMSANPEPDGNRVGRHGIPLCS
jgi:glycosyltransferase involved in cell wall biosynthesis